MRNMSTSESVEIRPAARGDVSAILALYGELESGSNLETPADESWGDSAWDRMMRSGQHLLVAVLDGRVVGTVTLIIQPTLRHQGATMAELENVVVDPNWRGRGVRSKLVRHALNIARGAGAYKLHLLSDFTTSDAYPFYEDLEFVHTGRGYKQYLLGD